MERLKLNLTKKKLMLTHRFYSLQSKPILQPRKPLKCELNEDNSIDISFPLLTEQFSL